MRAGDGVRLCSRNAIPKQSEQLAGKRASLSELTQQLLRVPGVEDAVVFQPAADGDAERLVALVVAPRMDAAAVRRALREAVHAAFLPRPIRMVDALPRSETGKLTRAALQRAFVDAGAGALVAGASATKHSGA